MIGFNCAGLVGLLDNGSYVQPAELVHDLHGEVLRFMGGTISQTNPLTDDDLRKAVAFAKECSLPIIWVANIFSTANEMLLAIKAFQSAGVEVRGVEIGNETYTHETYKKNPAKYLRRAAIYAKTLRTFEEKNSLQHIPVSVVIAPSGRMKEYGEMPAVTARLQAWNLTVLACDWCDAFSLHCYTRAESSIEYTSVWMPEFLASLSQSPAKEIWITEHGLTDGHGTQIQRDHYVNMLDALTTFPQVTIATAHNLCAGGEAYNFIEAKPTGPGKPINYVLTLLGEAAKAHL